MLAEQIGAQRRYRMTDDAEALIVWIKAGATPTAERRVAWIEYRPQQNTRWKEDDLSAFAIMAAEDMTPPPAPEAA